jgi:DNA invertase Pin-like site-specific DNA recombinase
MSRRSWLRIGGLALGGLALPDILRAEARNGQRNPAKGIIMVLLPGGPTHLDTFDLKPDAPVEIRGEFRPIATNVPGIDLCELMPRLARRADKLAIVRSLVGFRDDHNTHWLPNRVSGRIMTSGNHYRTRSQSMSKPTYHSYARFSSLGKQSIGDSERRQVESAEAWCKRHGHKLSPLGTDRGLSGFHGAHRKKGKLRDFLQLVKTGQIPPGDVLLVEKVTRLSREGVKTALQKIVFELIEAGIAIQFISPEMNFDGESINGPMLHVLIALLASAYQESKDKSDYAKSVWRQRRLSARTGKKPMFNRLPAWLAMKNGKILVVPERAAVVRRIFDLAAAGYGHTRIVAALIAEGVPAFGERKVSEERTRSQFSGVWTKAYVARILRDRRAVGECQPCGAGRKPEGPPIPDYFPAVITEEQWLLASVGRTKRKNEHAPRQSKHLNIFAGLVRNAVDGDPFVLHADGHSDGSLQYTYLVSARAIGGRGKWVSFSYPVFERAILKMLREVSADEVFPPTKDEQAPRLTVLREELKKTRGEVASLTADLANGYSAAITDVLRKKESREAELAELVQQEEAKAARPAEPDWKEFCNLASALDGAEDKEDARLRLRAALQRRVGRITVLVVSRPKRVKVLVAQVWFADSHLRRDYVIYHKSPANRNSRGFWCVRSWTPADLQWACFPDQFDLRSVDPTVLGEDDEGRQAWVDGWKDTELHFLGTDVEYVNPDGTTYRQGLTTDDLEQLVFKGCEKHLLP